MSDIVARLGARAEVWGNMIDREAKAEIERLELELAAWKQSSDLKATEIERLRARNKQLQDMFDRVDPEMDKLHAEIERLRADKTAVSQTASDYLHKVERLQKAAVWHCEACGTVTRSGECDCTKMQTGTQRLVPFDYRACLDAENKQLRAENERLRAQWRDSDQEKRYMENKALRAKIERLKAVLARRQEPEGEREERVAEWLRSRGYNVAGRARIDGESVENAPQEKKDQ